MRALHLAELAFVGLAAVAVHAFVRMALRAEERRVCAPLCALAPAYAGTNRTAPAPDGLGQVIHSVGRDVTAQRLAEQGREQAEHRYRMLYEATPAMLHSIDTAGRIIAVSEAWLNRLGFDRSEVLGRP